MVGLFEGAIACTGNSFTRALIDTIPTRWLKLRLFTNLHVNAWLRFVTWMNFVHFTWNQVCNGRYQLNIYTRRAFSNRLPADWRRGGWRNEELFSEFRYIKEISGIGVGHLFLLAYVCIIIIKVIIGNHVFTFHVCINIHLVQPICDILNRSSASNIIAIGSINVNKLIVVVDIYIIIINIIVIVRLIHVRSHPIQLAATRLWQSPIVLRLKREDLNVRIV